MIVAYIPNVYAVFPVEDRTNSNRLPRKCAIEVCLNRLRMSKWEKRSGAPNQLSSTKSTTLSGSRSKYPMSERMLEMQASVAETSLLASVISTAILANPSFSSRIRLNLLCTKLSCVLSYLLRRWNASALSRPTSLSVSSSR